MKTHKKENTYEKTPRYLSTKNCGSGNIVVISPKTLNLDKLKDLLYLISYIKKILILK